MLQTKEGIPLSKWLLAAFLLCSSKKGMSAHQLRRTLGVTYKTARFLAHRIRFAMDSNTGLFGSGKNFLWPVTLVHDSISPLGVSNI